MTDRARKRPRVSTWHRRRDLERARTRQLIAVVVLGVLATSWSLLWLSVETDDVGPAWFVLELVTLVPLAFGARRVARFSSQIAGIEASDEDELAEVEALRGIHESMSRAGVLVASLEHGPARDAAMDALNQAERAARLLRPLLRRRTQLQHLLEGSESKEALATLTATLTACEDDIRRLDAKVDDVAAAVASLVDVASDASFEIELERVRRSRDGVRALVAGFRELDGIDGS